MGLGLGQDVVGVEECFCAEEGEEASNNGPEEVNSPAGVFEWSARFHFLNHLLLFIACLSA